MRWLKLWGASRLSEPFLFNPSEIERIAYSTSIIPFEDLEVSRILDVFEGFQFKLNEPVELTHEQAEYRNVLLTMVRDEELSPQASIALTFIQFARCALEEKRDVWKIVLNILLVISLECDSVIDHLAACNLTKHKVLTAAYYAYYQMPQKFLESLDRITNEAARKRLLRLLNADTFLKVLPWWHSHKVSRVNAIVDKLSEPAYHARLSDKSYQLIVHYMEKYTTDTADQIVRKLWKDSVFQNLLHLGADYDIEEGDCLTFAMALYKNIKYGEFEKYLSMQRKLLPMWSLPLDRQIDILIQMYNSGLCDPGFSCSIIKLHYGEDLPNVSFFDDIVFIEELLKHGLFYFVALLENHSDRRPAPLMVDKYEFLLYRYISGSLMHRPGFPSLDYSSKSTAVDLLKRLIEWDNVEIYNRSVHQVRRARYTVKAIRLLLKYYPKNQFSEVYEPIILRAVRKFFHLQILDGELFDLVFKRNHRMFLFITECLLKDGDAGITGAFLAALIRYSQEKSLLLLTRAIKFGEKMALLDKERNKNILLEDTPIYGSYFEKIWKSAFCHFSTSLVDQERKIIL